MSEEPSFKNVVEPFVVMLFVSWFFLNIVLVFIGGVAHDSCEKPWRRVEYIIPGYQLGCWLGDRP